MMPNTQTLIDLGLTEKEAKVYLALYGLGQVTAYAIAEHSGIKRSTVYVTLEGLRTKDLVLRIPHPNKQLFVAKSLDDFLYHQKETLTRGLSLSQTLKNQEKKSTQDVFHFQGVKGVRQSLLYRMDDMKGGGCSAMLGHLTSDELISIFNEFHQKVVSIPDFRMQILVNQDDYYKRFKELELWRKTNVGKILVRLTDRVDFPSDFSIEVYHKHQDVLFARLIADKEKHATIIETEAIAESFKRLFDSLWENGKNV